jgi:hypothetical protein
MSTASDGSIEFDLGTFRGTLVDDRPHGLGRLDFVTDDSMGRQYYEGQWIDGKNTGKGKMVFLSADVYVGDFDEGVPHGHGEFTYGNGDVETAQWENGARHGLSRYVSTNDHTVEEAMFWEGVADGPATLRGADGTVEEFQYNKGVRDGPAKRKLLTGETMEFNYVEGEITGVAILNRSDGTYEEVRYANGLKVGPAVDHLADGSREEHSYTRGFLSGAAVLHGVNGDRLEFTYKNGKKCGPLIYNFSDGSVERSFFDEITGVQTGPTQFKWPNGAVREGVKVNGQWDGEVFYMYAEGPRQGKRDVEKWKTGQMVSSQKFHGDSITIHDWEDLKKLEGGSSSPDKDVYYDCISPTE